MAASICNKTQQNAAFRDASERFGRYADRRPDLGSGAAEDAEISLFPPPPTSVRGVWLYYLVVFWWGIGGELVEVGGELLDICWTMLVSSGIWWETAGTLRDPAT